MPDFARTGSKTTGFKRSPFASFKERQKFAVLVLAAKKIGLGLALFFVSFFLSLALVSFLFLHFAKWHQTGPLGVVFLTSEESQILKQTTVMWVDPEKREISLLGFPGDLSVHTPGGTSYSLKAVYGLYALDHKSPEEFLKALVRNIRIDTQFFIVREGKRPPTETTLRWYVSSLIFENKDSSFFPIADRFALLWYVWFGGAKVVHSELPSSVASSENGLDNLDYDSFIQKRFLNVDVKKDGYSVAVVNASAQSRLASTLGRLFTAFGFNVLSVSDTPNILEQGRVVVKDGRLIGSETVSVLKRYISGEVQVSASVTNEYRSDIVVFLGKKEAADFIP